MSRVTLIATRTAVRAREERYYRSWKRAVKKGRTLKQGTPEHAKNAKSRVWYKDHYLAARKRRRALDAQISKLPIVEVDQAGINFIIANEGVRTQPYNDSRGFATIGVGHLIGQRSVTPADRLKYHNFTRHDADVLLARDLDSFEKVVADSFKPVSAIQATHNRFNALTSFAFNIGAGGYKSSSAARAVRSGNVNGVVDGLRMWKKPAEIAARREREVALFRR